VAHMTAETKIVAEVLGDGGVNSLLLYQRRERVPGLRSLGGTSRAPVGQRGSASLDHVFIRKLAFVVGAKLSQMGQAKRAGKKAFFRG
jgi:hypothetical protein